MSSRQHRFDATVLPHLDAAYALAKWIVADAVVAEDVVQDAFVSAYKSLDLLRGVDAKPWLLQIVRNQAYKALGQRRKLEETMSEIEELGIAEARSADDPEANLIRNASAEAVRSAVEALPDLLREVIVLREFEELSYAEIGQVISRPLGTVMSRLSRARAQLASMLRLEVQS